MTRFPRIRFIALMMALTISFAIFAGPVGRQNGGGSSMDWQLNSTGHDKATLTWSCAGENGSIDFKNGKNVSLNIADLGDVQNATCSWQITLTPKVSSDVAKKLAAARSANDDKAARKIMKDAGFDPEAATASGAFTVKDGMFVSTDGSEGNSARPAAGLSTNALGSRPGAAPIAVNDQVIADDLIVQGSACVGLDCVNNESFGFDTIRLKENNTRIKFDDTSASTGFPANDWQLTANDSASGGASKFSIEDISGSKVPFTVTAGASTNSIFVDSSGRVGFRTSTPVLDLHVNTSNTPALRLEQNNTGGFSAQTWDVAGNEANFFVRDVTSGSRLPFRIRPGAPTSSVDISADGLVGIGGISEAPTGYTMTAQVISSADTGNFIRLYNSNGTYEMGGVWMPNTAKTGGWLFGTNNAGGSTWTYGTGGNEGSAVTDAKDTGDGITTTTVGNVGFNCNNPTSDFVISASSNCSGSQSSINAGATAFTVTSSRTLKENLEPVAVPDLLDRMAKIDVYQYDFKQGPKDRIGLMAEDFHTVFGRGSDKVIDGQEVEMALWLAVKELTAQNKQLQERINALEQKQQ